MLRRRVKKFKVPITVKKLELLIKRNDKINGKDWNEHKLRI